MTANDFCIYVLGIIIKANSCLLAKKENSILATFEL